VVGAVDGLRIEQVLTNLLTNALKYSPAERPIDVTLELDPTGSVATIRVRDHGPGVPPERREHLFERFYRAGEQDHVAGLGLGLYISRQIVALHRGTLDASFPEDGGTCMTVTLSLDAAADSATVPEEAAWDASLTGPSWSLTTTRVSAN
jgi:two-component system OmpR family sensor kinase